MDRKLDKIPLAHLKVGVAQFGPQERWGALAFVYRSTDLRRAAGVWRFGPGSFDYDANHDELLYIIEGEVMIETEDRDTLLLKRGDLAFFPEHRKTRWEASALVRAVFCSVASNERLDY